MRSGKGTIEGALAALESMHPAFNGGGGDIDSLNQDGRLPDKGKHGQAVYRWGSYGASVITHSMAYSKFEVAVIHFAGLDNDFTLTYDTPLTGDVEPFPTAAETNDFLAKIKAFAETSS